MIRIYLVGYMGAGKTTLGMAFANRENLSFIDLDTFIENRFHQTVRQIFDEQGENAFREMERRTLHEVADFENVVISTGGGAPCFFDNMDFMNATGTTVYLTAAIDELARRLEPHIHTRPVLQDLSGDDLQQHIAQNIAARSAWYGQAHLIFDTGRMETADGIDAMCTRFARLLGLPSR
jgi:shikimate kinase